MLKSDSWECHQLQQHELLVWLTLKHGNDRQKPIENKARHKNI